METHESLKTSKIYSFIIRKVGQKIFKKKKKNIWKRGKEDTSLP